MAYYQWWALMPLRHWHEIKKGGAQHGGEEKKKKLSRGSGVKIKCH